MSRVDVYQQVNDIVIKGLQEKGLEWFKPWNGGGEMNAPINRVTGKRYKGINTFILGAEMGRGYEFNEWFTWKQAKQVLFPELKDAPKKPLKSSKDYENELREYNKFYAGLSLKYGDDFITEAWEKVEGRDTIIVFWKMSYRVGKKFFKSEELADAQAFANANGLKVEKSFSVQHYKVYNIGLLDVEPRRPKVEFEEIDFQPIEEAERLVKGYKTCPDIQHKSQSAFYNPSLDFVNMPKKESFKDVDTYYHTLFHELVHSTGHKSRLNRSEVGTSAFGSKDYSKEELVAEIGAMYLSGLSQISPSVDQSKAYINGWVKKLTEHKKEALFAMTQASKAVDYIVGE